MLHNSGPYGPNETPVNMAPSVNMTPTGHMNIVSNINHLAKLGHGNPPAQSGPYGLGDYAVYHHQHYNMAPQMSQFPNNQYQHLGFQHNFMHHGSSSIPEGNYQNNMMPMNLNIHNDHNDVINYPYEKRYSETRPEIIKEQDYKKIPLNIPQIPNKSLPKQPLFDNDYVHNDSFHNPNDNLDLSMKTHDRIPLTNSRRKKIENTVKLIENILINSSNMPKTPITETVYETPSNLNNRNSEDDESRNVTTNANNLETETDPLSLTVEDTQREPNEERDSIIKSPINYSHDNPVSVDSADDQSSGTEDIKPVGITIEIPPKDDETIDTREVVEIKIEKASWTDSEYVQPFFRDSNAFQREDALDCKIIDGDSSVSEAKTAICNDVKLEDFFECPHCGLLFRNPKRFLIHTKWHTFGLTIEKRTELMREKEEKKNQRREAKIIERMNAKEVTTDKKPAGKTWACKDCDKIFSAKGSLKNHRQRYHPTRVRECRICHKSIAGWVAMKNHMKTHVAEAGVGYQCSECPKRFKYSHSLAKHSDTHLEKVHACQDCPKKFGSQALLKMHMKTHERHSRGATFRCTYCAKGFFESYSLQVHERTHRNERPFLCEICNTSYGTNSSLKRHLKVSHSSAKPYECTVCHRSFSTESIRDRHELRLHGKPEDFKFPCKQCNCKYAKLKDLQKHVYKAHPKNRRKKKVKSDTEPMEEDSE